MGELTHTVSGNIASFRSADKADIKSLKVHFAPVQEGTGDPSPSNVMPISGWTGVEVSHCGKNIIPSSLTFVNNKAINNYGVIGDTPNYKYSEEYIPIRPSQSYVCQRYKSESSANNIAFVVVQYDKNKNFIKTLPVIRTIAGTGVQSGAFVTEDNAYFIRINIALDELDGSNYQIEPGDSVTDFSEYYGTTIPVSWSSEAGTVYGGYVDLVTGELVQEWEKVYLNDPTKWIDHATKAYRYDVEFDREATGSNVSGLLSNIAKTDSTLDFWCRWTLVSTGLFAIRWTKNYADPPSLETIKQMASNNEIYICYKMNSPIVHQLTTTQLKTLLDHNNIWSNANGDVEVEYAFTDRLAKKRMEIGNSVLDNRPKIRAYDKQYHNDGSVKDYTGRCITKLYPVNYTGNQGITHYGLQYYFVCYKDNGATLVDYWSTNSTIEERRNGAINDGSDCIAATIQTDMIDDCYLINRSTGEIFFAGKNSIYFGHKNISELT